METASFFDDVTYGEERPLLKVLADTPWTKEIRITFKAGQEMKAHKAPYPIAVQVLEGSIDFGVGENRHLMEKGMLITLPENMVHDLKATADSVVRLSMHKLSGK